jgi:hypothetical protein
MKPKATLFEIDHHPAIPPADLLKKWEDLWFDEEEHADVLLIRAFQAGADQELEACCKWLESEPDPGHVDLLRSCATALRTVRRPKPPSLKEQALQALESLKQRTTDPSIIEPLRLALEQLND